jgi:hypothetical protein
MSDISDMILSAAVMQKQGMEQAHVAIEQYANMNNDGRLKEVAHRYASIIAHLDAVITILKTNV